MDEIRRTVTVIGPGAAGTLRVRVDSEPEPYDVNVPAQAIPAAYQSPNAAFVAVMVGRNLVRIEPEGAAWLELQARMRAVLNAEWDPIGVAAMVADEYDGYIAGLHRLLGCGASNHDVAEHLKVIEVEHMGLSETARDRRLRVAASLRRVAQADSGPMSCS